MPTGRDVVADGSPTRWSPGSANRPSTFEERPVGLIAPPATRRATAASQRARRAAATVGANDLPPPGAAGCHRAPPAVTGHRWLSPAAGCHRAPLAVTGRRRPPSGAASCPVAPRPSLCQARPAGAGRAGRADEGGRHAAPSLSPPPCRPVGRQRSERSYAPFDTVEDDRPPLTAAGLRQAAGPVSRPPATIGHPALRQPGDGLHVEQGQQPQRTSVQRPVVVGRPRWGGTRWSRSDHRGEQWRRRAAEGPRQRQGREREELPPCRPAAGSWRRQGARRAGGGRPGGGRQGARWWGRRCCSSPWRWPG